VGSSRHSTSRRRSSTLDCQPRVDAAVGTKPFQAPIRERRPCWRRPQVTTLVARGGTDSGRQSRRSGSERASFDRELTKRAPFRSPTVQMRPARAPGRPATNSDSASALHHGKIINGGALQSHGTNRSFFSSEVQQDAVHNGELIDEGVMSRGVKNGAVCSRDVRNGEFINTCVINGWVGNVKISNDELAPVTPSAVS